MFLRVVDTIVKQEPKVAEDKLNNDKKLDRVGLSDFEQKELFSVHGKPLHRKSK